MDNAMPEIDDTLIATVRLAIYSAILKTGAAPAPADVARAHNLPEHAVEDAYRSLAASHVIVVQPQALAIWSAPPFSAVATAFRTTVAGGLSWHAPCAWDAFGIPATLGRDATIEARCAWSGERIPCGVRDHRSYGDGIIHLLVPAARFWEDIVYT
jgi:Alkylmercury lyase